MVCHIGNADGDAVVPKDAEPSLGDLRHEAVFVDQEASGQDFRISDQAFSGGSRSGGKRTGSWKAENETQCAYFEKAVDGLGQNG